MSQSSPEILTDLDQFYVETEQVMAELAQKVRGIVQSQVEVWRELPMLALQADGKFGYNSNLRNMYMHGLVRVGSGKHFANDPEQRPTGLYGVFIDCATGNILRLTGYFRNPEDPGYLADDSEVFHLLASKAAHGELKQLNAGEHKKFLLGIIDDPNESYYSETDEAKRQHKIADTIVGLKLTRRYVRSQDA
jgi:hypothetical protein